MIWRLIGTSGTRDRLIIAFALARGGSGGVMGMRQARLKARDDHEVAYYHVISRVVNREFVLGGEEH